MSNDENLPGVPTVSSDEDISEPVDIHKWQAIDTLAPIRRLLTVVPPKSMSITCVYDVGKGGKYALSYREKLADMVTTSTKKYYVHDVNENEQVVVYETDSATCDFNLEAGSRTYIDPKDRRYADLDCRKAVDLFMKKYNLAPSKCDVCYANVKMSCL